MAAEGSIERVEGKLRIKLRQDAPQARQRFSLAHEIGHLLIEKLTSSPNSADFRKFRSCCSVRDQVDEEAVADMFAASLLLPAWHMRSHIGDRLSLRRIEQASMTAGASLSAGLLRATALATTPCFAAMVRGGDRRRPRVMWVRCSSSVPARLVHELLEAEEMAEALVNQRLPLCAAADRSVWSRAEVIKREYSNIRTWYCFVHLTTESRWVA